MTADPVADHDQEFMALRPLLLGIAYRMLGTRSEAEDVVQDAYLRWERTERSRVRSARAYLTTTVTRLAVDHLRSARRAREQYVGPWLPEPLIVDDLERTVERREHVSTALMIVLERLTPDERAAWLLREVFDYPYAEVASILDRSETACRQLVSRARRHIAEQRGRFTASEDQHERLMDRFVQACTGGDMHELMALLTDDVVLLSDSGGTVRAARRPVEGRDKVAPLLLGILGGLPADARVELRRVNGEPGVIVRHGDGAPLAVVTMSATTQAIAGVHILVNPDKLRGV
ncbi:MAG TPA: RNA polymerase sigma-70 factor [Egibacteraceae bacterium]|nr:RNA polymerase sigma-70 factor [Egibacteraceae bacterium]